MYAKSTRPSAKRDDQIARSSLWVASEARDENVPAKRADFFLFFIRLNDAWTIQEFKVCYSSFGSFFRYKSVILLRNIYKTQLHHHWKFYHSRSSAKIEINSNLMVKGQGYMMDVTSLSKQALIIFGEWLKMCVM